MLLLGGMEHVARCIVQVLDGMVEPHRIKMCIHDGVSSTDNLIEQQCSMVEGLLELHRVELRGRLPPRRIMRCEHDWHAHTCELRVASPILREEYELVD